MGNLEPKEQNHTPEPPIVVSYLSEIHDLLPEPPPGWSWEPLPVSRPGVRGLRHGHQEIGIVFENPIAQGYECWFGTEQLFGANQYEAGSLLIQKALAQPTEESVANDLNAAVTTAIFRAEQLVPEEPAYREAWRRVSEIEEELAVCASVSEVEREIGMVGAVQAAIKAGDRERAHLLLRNYLARANGDVVRERLEELRHDSSRVLHWAEHRAVPARVVNGDPPLFSAAAPLPESLAECHALLMRYESMAEKAAALADDVRTTPLNDLPGVDDLHQSELPYYQQALDLLELIQALRLEGTAPTKG